MILNVTEKGVSDNSQIIIDIKYGQPSTDQLCEVIYGAGSLSGTRVLVHTGVVYDVDDDNPGANLNLVSRLIRKMNDLPLNLFLVRADVSEFWSEPLGFTVDVRPEAPPSEPFSNLGDQRAFREMEFWFAYIGSLNPGFYRSWTPSRDEDFLNFAYGHYTDIGNLQVREGWNSFGASVWVVQSDGGNNRLMDLWRENEAQLRDRFAGYETELEYVSSGLPRLAVKISDLPLGWLLGASVAEKLEFARELHGRYLGMVEFVPERFSVTSEPEIGPDTISRSRHSLQLSIMRCRQGTTLFRVDGSISVCT